MRLAKKIIYFSLFFAVFLAPAASRADTDISLTVTPAVIDIPACEKNTPICLDKKIITIKNNSAVRADVYAQVNDLSDSGIVPYGDPSELPAGSSLTRWIDFYRSMITIMPGQVATQTLRIVPSPQSQPGSYHAIIAFPTGGNLPEAKQLSLERNVPRVQINLNLIQHQVEQAEINRFAPRRNFFTNNVIGFVIKIKNIGTETVEPMGDITIYDKGGREVTSLPIISGRIAPDEIKDFSTGAPINLAPGKFKAIINLNYGQDNGKNLTDVVYFSYLPLALFLVLLLVLLSMLATAAFYWVKKSKKKHPAAPVEADKNLHYRSGSAPHPAVHHRYVVDLKKKEK
jgi:hypothetical protein